MSAIAAIRQGLRVAVARLAQARTLFEADNDGLLDRLLFNSEVDLRVLVGAIDNFAIECGWDAVHASLDSRTANLLARCGFSIHDCLVAKPVQPNSSSMNDGHTSIRAVRWQDMAFVEDVFKRSVAAGLSDLDRLRHTVPEIEDAALSHMRHILRRDALILIAEAGGQAVGLSVMTVEGESLHLHDTYVTEASRGRGIARTLNAAVERIAMARGCEKVIGSVTHAANSASLLAELESSGWAVGQINLVRSTGRSVLRESVS
ncbi:MAG TPA: GNAT family N-acetyltransferase [Propylenella sp.]|nr:GNAT family N-acetyltransferase [Propylenella sp.]